MEFTSKNLTFIIVTFNSKKVIFNCLNSLPKDFHKIIIENSSDQELKKELERNYVNTRVILSSNIGMGAGNNLGIKKTKTQFAYVLNPDVVLREDTLFNINNSISRLEDFAILSPISDDLNYPNYKTFNNNDLYKNNLIGNVEEIDGYSMIINKSYFPDNTFFDEEFFMYLENVDLCLRAKKNDGKIFIIKNSKIHHLGAQAVDDKYSREVELSRNWHWMWSKCYFNKKHRGFFITISLALSSLLKNSFKYLICLITFNRKKAIYKMRLSGTLNALLARKSWFRPEIN